MSWSKNFKIRHKLSLGFGSMVFLVFIMALTSYGILSSVRAIVDDLVEKDVFVAETSLQTYRAMLEARRSEKDYLLRYKTLGFEEARSLYVTRVQAQTAQMQINFQALQAHSGEQTFNAPIDEMMANTDRYEQSFLKAVDLIEERGHKDDGIVGEFREKVHEIEDFVTAQDLDQLTIHMLMMRRFEKDYLLRGEQGDIDDLHATVRLFKEDVQASDIPLDEQTRLVTLADEYEALFDQVVVIDIEVADAIQEFRDAVHLLEGPMTNLYEAAIVRQDVAYDNLNQRLRTLILIIITITVFMVIVSGLISRAIANPLSEAIQSAVVAANLISTGDLDVSLSVDRGDEMGAMAYAFNQMIDYQQNIAETATSLAAGNLDVRVTPQSERDVLGNAFAKMLTNLRKLTRENEAQIWTANGRSELNDVMRGQPEITSLIQNIIGYLCRYLGAQVGAIYLAQEKAFHLTGSYAFVERKNLSNRYALGEGLVGQAALERAPILISDVPDDYIKVNSGLGESRPRHILVIPLLFEKEVLGVLELGTLHAFNGIEREFITAVAENIAIAIHSARARTQVNDLLTRTQQQAEELQVQQEELRVTNEELAEQTERLKASEVRLREQQARLEESNAELEENTVALEEKQEAIDRQNQQLRAASEDLTRKAEELALASKYKSEFLANMSHELRTPLNSLLILSRMLATNDDGNLSDEQVEAAQIIYSGGQDLLSLINEILDLAKVESGKIDFQIESVFLQDMIDGLQAQFVPLAEEKGLVFDISIDADCPDLLRTDRKRTQQILKNLLSNAVKFTEAGSVTMQVSTVMASALPVTVDRVEADKFLAFTVVDTGIGISPVQRQVIFEAFQQADGGINRKYGGTGLGLSISRELAVSLGGGIDVDSAEGQGSTFTLYLPIDSESDGAVPASRLTKLTTTTIINNNAPTQPVKTRRGDSRVVTAVVDDRHTVQQQDKTLLIVEDDPAFAKTLYNFSHKKGFKCLVAHSGEEGLELAHSHSLDGIILDLNLPTMSGWEFMENVKQDPATRHIPVHIMSVYDTNILDAYKRGAIGYLTKPATKEALDDSFAVIESFAQQRIGTILLIEDDATLRQSVKKLLDGEDVTIVEATNGAEGLAILEAQQVDCTILDLSLPDMSGEDVLLALHNDAERYCQSPIIIYTGRELTRSESERIMQYADSIIIKSVKSPERLLDETALFLHRVVADMPREKQQTIRQLYEKESHLSGKRILIVDDDMRNSFALSKLLSERGIMVQIAANGQKALEKLTTGPHFDLVLMDVMMPVMDGLETTRRIREQSQFRDLPILALTAKAMKGDREACIAAGANDYLSKPIDVDRLFSMLRVWLY